MKVYKPGTDCKADFTISANGRACEEYVLPNSTEEATAGICFIPVSDDALITIQGTFSGSMLYGRVDVLADGAFIANRIIEDHESKEGIVKYRDNRRVEVKTFMHVPNLNDCEYRKQPKVVEGSLVTKRLSDKQLNDPLHGGHEATGIGVGSITLILSLNQELLDTYEAKVGEPAYSSFSLGQWRNSTGDVADSGIQPEHEMSMDVFPDSNPVKDKKATLFRRDLRAPRFGTGPWAYLIFYYRSQAAIDAAGCVRLTKDKALPAEKGTFVRASNRELLTCKEEPESQPSSPLPEPTYTQAPATKKPKGLLGRTLDIGGHQLAREPVPERDTSTHFNQSENLSNAKQDPSTESDTFQKVGDHVSSNNAYAASPLPKQNDKPHSSQHPKPRVSFADPLTTAAAKEGGTTDSSVTSPAGADHFDDMGWPSLPAQASQHPKPRVSFADPLTTTTAVAGGMTDNFVTSPMGEDHFDDRALPSLPAHASQATVARSIRDTSRDPNIDPRLFEPSPNKRSVSQANLTASPSPSLSRTSSPAKRLRSEELREKKFQLERALQEKRERKVAMQKKLDGERMERERQQQMWAEEDARRREEEEMRRLAEQAEEEENRKADAEMAELEALQEANEKADLELELVAEHDDSENREWEEVLRARGQGGLR